VAPTAGTYSVVWSDQEYFYFPLYGMLAHPRVTRVEIGIVRVNCPAQEHICITINGISVINLNVIHLSAIFFPRTASTRSNLQTNVWKNRKISWASSSQATSFKLGKYNLLPSIVTLRLTNCVKFKFGKSYLPSDSHTNTIISDRSAYPSRWRRKP